MSLDRDVSELRETLAREEQELFDAGYRAARDVRAWKRRRTARLTTSAIYKRAAPDCCSSGSVLLGGVATAPSSSSRSGSPRLPRISLDVPGFDFISPSIAPIFGRILRG